jgi:hypothetical protein
VPFERSHRSDTAPRPCYKFNVMFSPPNVGTDMSATYRSERDRGIKEYRQQLAELRKKWPLAFPVHDEDVRPLAVDAAHEMARNAFGSNGTFFAFFVMTDLVKRSKPVEPRRHRAPSRRVGPYEPSRDGKIRYTVVPRLLLSRLS